MTMSRNQYDLDSLQPTPWHKTETGESIIAWLSVLTFLGAGGLTYLVDGFLSEIVAVVAIVALVVWIIYSGRAATKTVGRMMDK